MAEPIESSQRLDAVRGCLLGMAAGDAIGLPYEGLTGRRAARLFGKGDLRHHFVFGRGMVSDDTEHACMTALSLWEGEGSVERFGNALARRLRWWLLGCPAGVGLGTLRAILKLWVGFPPNRSGVCSAGNGPAMRAPIIGVLLAGRPDELKLFVRASTRLTHTDPRTEQGALAVALAAAYAASHSEEVIEWQSAIAVICERIDDQALLDLLRQVATHLEMQSSARTLADEMGLSRGVSGYVYHTVPIALFCWLRHHDDYREAVTQAIRLGGDTDTVAGITGALAATTSGVEGIPQSWLSDLIDWSYNRNSIEEIANRVAGTGDSKEPGRRSQSLPIRLCRNIVFVMVVLRHGFRRLLPPY